MQEHTALSTGEDRSPKAKWTYAIYVVYFLVALSTSFAVSAMNKVEEMALLSRQHSRGFSALGREAPREIPGAVQDELTLLRGWQGILDSIVGGAAAIFLAALRSNMLPLSVTRVFGFVSGTKKILMLALVGILTGRVFNSLFCRFKFPLEQHKFQMSPALMYCTCIPTHTANGLLTVSILLQSSFPIATRTRCGSPGFPPLRISLEVAYPPSTR